MYEAPTPVLAEEVRNESCDQNAAATVHLNKTHFKHIITPFSTKGQLIKHVKRVRLVDGKRLLIQFSLATLYRASIVALVNSHSRLRCTIVLRRHAHFKSEQVCARYAVTQCVSGRVAIF